MNVNIPFIPDEYSNNISCLPTTVLSAYILTEQEQQYIAGLLSDTESVVSSTALSASVKAGTTVYTQPEMNKLYIRKDDIEFGEGQRNALKDFINSKMVGNEVVEFDELNDLNYL